MLRKRASMHIGHNTIYVLQAKIYILFSHSINQLIKKNLERLN